jgi:hypothetical protein
MKAKSSTKHRLENINIINAHINVMKQLAFQIQIVILVIMIGFGVQNTTVDTKKKHLVVTDIMMKILIIQKGQKNI